MYSILVLIFIMQWKTYIFPSGRYGGDGQQRMLHWRRGTMSPWYSDSQVPDRARHRDELGWYGEDLAPYFLQRTASGSWWTSGSLDRGATKPQGQSGKDDTGSCWLFCNYMFFYNFQVMQCINEAKMLTQVHMEIGYVLQFYHHHNSLSLPIVYYLSEMYISKTESAVHTVYQFS